MLQESLGINSQASKIGPDVEKHGNAARLIYGRRCSYFEGLLLFTVRFAILRDYTFSVRPLLHSLAMPGSRIFGQKAKPAAPPAGVYHDDPDRDDSASVSAISLHSNVGTANAEEEDFLPPYVDDPESASSEAITGAQNLVSEEDFQASSEKVIVRYDAKGSATVVLSKRLTSDPVALESFIKSQTKIHPAACIWLHGEHSQKKGTDKNKKEKVIDFDIKIDVTNTISCRAQDTPDEACAPEWSYLHIADNLEKRYRGTLFKSVNNRTRPDVEGQALTPTLQEWCHLFCANGSKLKSFEIRHSVIHRDEEKLRRLIEANIRSTNYRGHITIGFQLSPRSITVQTPHAFNKLRHNKFFYWFCIILQFWIFTWPILFFMTKRWAITSIMWPYRRYTNRNQQQESGMIPRSISEDDWARKYQYTIQQGVLSRAQDGTFIEYMPRDEQEERRRQEQERERRASEPQSGLVGGALSLMRGVGNIIQENQNARGVGWGYDC